MYGMKNRQRGNSALSWLVFLLIGGVVLSLGLKLMPLYMDDHAVKNVTESLTNRPGSSTASVNQVRTWIQKGLQLNAVKLEKNEIIVARENGVVTVDIDYERRVHVFHNVDMILSFKHDWKAGN
ncbi:DUF4845 domain-containing protein [Endozoicomonas ascidiicola]|uniref:DUF4845 domain-containing protein n=1 Tax=Endozoicomonas ascidiicola TaxID=1698521 RepID=UPI00082A79B5|nr:DUF4845 domain-containing protein [Endozoicomonas ascidiicola]